MSVSRLLDPEIISRLAGLELRARAVSAGFMSGLQRSPYQGFSVEFAQHRQYVTGDDMRYMDWRVFGRADRFYIKQYEEETNLSCHILLDASASMSYGGGLADRGRTKFEYAATLAACVAYLLTQQQDAAGLVLFDERVRMKMPSASGRAHLGNLVRALESSGPAHSTNVKVLLHRLAEELSKRSMVVLVSDLLADRADIVSGLEHICYAGHELIVLHVLDDDEWNLPLVENVLFEGLEEPARLLADPQGLRPGYLAALAEFVASVRRTCLSHRADYVQVNTRDRVDLVLSRYLAERAGGGGARRR